jgi:hypothetical protein
MQTWKNKRILLDVGKEVGLEVKARETKYIFRSIHLNSGQDPNIKSINKLYENNWKGQQQT